VSAAHCEMPSMKIGLRDQVHELRAGEQQTFALSRPG
jgi:hypothetical protein